MAIVGPTASGKSDLALAVAEQFGGEVVNYDSIQVYRHFRIGAAKLREEERRGIPHHLVDILEPNEVFTAGEFARRAGEVIRGIRDRGRLPVLVGGTGFYLRALLSGLFPGPARDEALRARLGSRSGGRLHRLLKRFDPAAARRIHPNDRRKLVRALEVTLVARRPMTELFEAGRQGLEGFRTLKIGLHPAREALYSRIDRRAAAMFEAGLVEETRGILALGFAETCKPFESLGYRQALQVLRGELKVRDAIFHTQRATRQYAKRQMTWFRREEDVAWFRGFGQEEEIRRGALGRVADFLLVIE